MLLFEAFGAALAYMSSFARNLALEGMQIATDACYGRGAHPNFPSAGQAHLTLRSFITSFERH